MLVTLFKFAVNGSFYFYTFLTSFTSFLHTVLPFGLDVGLIGVCAYYLTRLKKPDPSAVERVFGPDPWSKESEQSPAKVVRCIAHRGAGLDAPENTMEAFQYCVSQNCDFVELDVRTSRDGKLVLLHDQGLERLTGSGLTDVHTLDWEKIKDLDIASTHPNRAQFKEVHICLLDQALDYLMKNNVRVIIDVKGEDRDVINGILEVFRQRPTLHQHAAVTCFNPFQLYQIRRGNPNIIGAISYRPYCFSAMEYDAEHGPNKPRFGDNLVLHALLRAADFLHSGLWRWSAKWCAASAVLLHKDIVSVSEVHYWKELGVRCIGWSVNRPVEKLYWRGVLRSPYLANTLIGEPNVEVSPERENSDRAGPIVDKLIDTDKTLSSGQN